MPGFPAARQGDWITHDMVTPCGMIQPPAAPAAQGPVEIEGLPAAYVGCQIMCGGLTAAGPAHPPKPPADAVSKGSATVFIHGQPAARWLPSGDPGACGVFLGDAKAMLGRTVMIGDAAPFGMMTRAEEIADAMKQLQADWPNLTPDQRKQRLKDIMDAQFKAIGVPAPAMDFFAGSSPVGYFNPKTWTLNMSADMLFKDKLSDEDCASVGGTMAHEGRHAEQYYYAAREDAAKGNDADQVAKDVGIPKDVADKATQDKAPMGPGEKALGDRSQAAFNGDGKDYSKKTQADVDKKQAEMDKVLRNPNATEEQKDKAVDAYAEALNRKNQTMPHERDAEDVEAEVKNRLK